MFSLEIIPYSLKFRFEAGTSRGVLKEKQSWFLILRHSDFPGREGRGEAGLLPGLSPENPETFEEDLRRLADFILPQMETVPRNWQRLTARWLEKWEGPWLPSALFALETAWLDWVNGGKELICDADFHAGLSTVPINGLVWMNQRPEMEKQAREKRDAGFDTIKFKVGALDWQQELEMLQQIREEIPEMSIRLDANGAWKPDEALKKLEQLAELNIESIEQPIAPGQTEALAELCRNSPVLIALDEELIGRPFDHQKFSILESAQPAFVVLKPALLGGLGQCHQWICMAEDLGIGWWITSMLESNIGLNAIAQLAAHYKPLLPQGLGTGQLFENNTPSALELNGSQISRRPQ
jgi:O-succinylbenzoate synthase